jgi:uncharacterized membrane protein YkoI
VKNAQYKELNKTKLTTVFAIVTAGVLGLSLIGLSPMLAAAEYKHHYNMPEITGTISASESHKENLDKAQITFSEASDIAQSAVEEGQLTDGKLGVVNGFLVYTFKVVDAQDDIHKVIVDAGEGNTLYISEGKSWDDLKRYGHGNKWSHHKEMMEKFAQMSPEEMTQKFTQFKEMKQAFDAISDDDQQTIKSHFKEMKMQYHDLPGEERDAKKAEYKAKMEVFAEMTLEQKIAHLQEFAATIRAQN